MIKTPIFILISLLFGVLLLSQCKKPVAAFNTDKSNYKAGDTIRITNNSKSAASYTWTLTDPTGAKFTQNDQNSNSIMILDITAPDGAYVLSLSASTYDDKKISTFNKVLIVKTTTAKVDIFVSTWLAPTTHQEYVLGVNGKPLKSNFNGMLPVGHQEIDLMDPTGPNEYFIDKFQVLNLMEGQTYTVNF